MTTKTEKSTFANDFLQAADLAIANEASPRQRQSWEAFKAVGFPEAKDEEYRFTPVTRLLAKAFEASELITSTPAQTLPKDEKLFSHLDCYKLVFTNGRFDQKNSILPDSGLMDVRSLSEVLSENPDLVDALLNKIPASKDPFALLNDALWQDGILINVSRNITVDKPIVIYHQHDATKNKVSSHTRLIIQLEKSASLTVVEKTNTLGELPVFNTIKEDIVVEENASFIYCKLQDDQGELIQLNNTTIYQHNNSRTDTYTFTLDGKLIRNNLNIIIDGEGCESHFNGLYFSKGETLVDNHTVVDHRKPNSFSNELYKGLMDDKSKGIFNGKIFVRPHAQKTNAFQSNRNILLSGSATINTKPQLEIWADDVKCSHGCTTGQIDDEALFYLRSRGIPKSTAKAMLLYAFAGEVLEAIKDENIKSYIDGIVSERLHKNF